MPARLRMAGILGQVKPEPGQGGKKRRQDTQPGDRSKRGEAWNNHAVRL